VGKETEYNLEKIYKLADEMEGLNSSTGRGKFIQVMLAQTYSPELCPDPTGWLMSEKLDGVRCYWNGECMFTRNGNPFYPPDWFIDGLPKGMTLDGELWTGRADFQKIVSIVRRQDQSDEWKGIKYMIFDAPSIKGKFSQRLKKFTDEIEKLH
jgi:DNA ligase-1